MILTKANMIYNIYNRIVDWSGNAWCFSTYEKVEKKDLCEALTNAQP